MGGRERGQEAAGELGQWLQSVVTNYRGNNGDDISRLAELRPGAS